MAIIPGDVANAIASQNANSKPSGFGHEMGAATPILIDNNNMYARHARFCSYGIKDKTGDLY